MLTVDEGRVDVSGEHMDGYKYKPRLKIVEKQPWDILPAPDTTPVCSVANWQHQDLKFEIGSGIAYLTMNRPDVSNVIRQSLSQALSDACIELHKNKEVRVVVLQSVGKMFCAGASPQAFMDKESMSDVANKKADIAFMRFLHYFQSLPQFTIGLCQGSCMGSGLGLLAVCDFVVSIEAARFTCADVKLGTLPAAIAPFLTTKIGPSNTKRMLCLGENLSAPQVQRMGLIQEVVEEASDFTAIVAELCESLTQSAPIAMGRSKRLVQNVAARPITPALAAYTGGELASIRIGTEAIKGMVAVQSRVKPYWAENQIKPMY
mmetsp:Transcript_11146/g.25305  ORF Transcript_11146/g.25305 Transcript_11146/m.25305 type:complete len:319 (-) Transcript_11146:31-987(-)